MILTLKKLKELPDARHPNNIEEGFEIQLNVGKMWAKPEIGERFPPFTYWSTSLVQEIIDDKTFRTFNSIYEYEYKTEPNELSKKDYEMMLETGMMWEIFPEATGDYETDILNK